MCGEPGTGTSSNPLCGACAKFRAGGPLCGSGMLLMLLLRGIAGRSFPRSGKTVAPPKVCAALLLVGSARSRPRSRSPCSAILKTLGPSACRATASRCCEFCPTPEVGTAPASDNLRSVEEATGQSLDNGSMDFPLPSKPTQAKRRRRPKAKTDLKGGASCQSTSSSSGATPSLFRVIAANVTSLFSRAAAVCAIGFGVAFLAETARLSPPGARRF